MSERLPTVAAALAWATAELRAASDTPRLDAELLLAHVLGWGRPRTLAERGHALSDSQRSDFRALVARRAALEPVAYLVGRREFYGLDLLVDRRVLVPRPETELLVELALRHAQRRGAGPLAIADVGTGSGAIALALAAHLPAAQIYATDISPEALAVAGRNAALHGLAERVRLAQGDLLDALPAPVDLLVSNPPYTILPEISAGVRLHEPHLALDGGPDGLDVYRRLLAQAPAKLRPGGAIMLEIGAAQAQAVAALARQHLAAARTSVHKDLAGLDRAVVIERGDISDSFTEIV